MTGAHESPMVTVWSLWRACMIWQFTSNSRRKNLCDGERVIFERRLSAAVYTRIACRSWFATVLVTFYLFKMLVALACFSVCITKIMTFSRNSGSYISARLIGRGWRYILFLANMCAFHITFEMWTRLFVESCRKLKKLWNRNKNWTNKWMQAYSNSISNQPLFL